MDWTCISLLQTQTVQAQPTQVSSDADRVPRSDQRTLEPSPPHSARRCRRRCKSSIRRHLVQLGEDSQRAEESDAALLDLLSPLSLSSSTMSSSSRERQPLLQNRHRGAPQDVEAHHSTQQQKATPLPRLQIAIICLLRAAEPIALFIIFPTINFQLHEVLPDVPVERIGYWSGIVESCFALCQFIVSPLWGRLSDRVGRKPVLVASMCGLAISMNSFGLSRSFKGIIASRCINGLFGGTVGILKTILGESTDATNNARAFSLLPIFFSVGSIVGPWLGAQFSHPADKYPALDFPFLRKHPYWLPCGIVSVYIAISIVVALFFLKETLPGKARKQEAERLRHEAHQRRNEAHQHEEEQGANEADALLSSDRQENDANQIESRVDAEESKVKPPSIRELLTLERINILTTQMLLNLMNISWSSLIPLFCFETINHGGVGLSKEGIGHLLASQGVVSILVQTFLFPWAEKRMGGPLPVYKLGLVFFLPSFICLPIAHIVAQRTGGNVEWAKWTPLIAGTAFKALSGMAVVCATLLINNCAPRASLGTLNGLSQSFGSLSRAIGPTAATSLFAFSSTHRGLGWLTWAAAIAVAAVTWIMSHRITVNRPIQQQQS